MVDIRSLRWVGEMYCGNCDERCVGVSNRACIATRYGHGLVANEKYI